MQGKIQNTGKLAHLARVFYFQITELVKIDVDLS